MSFFESKKIFLETLKEKGVDENLAENLVEKVVSVGDKYNLTMGEIGEVFILIDKLLKETIDYSDYMDGIFDKLGVTEGEIEEIVVFLRKEILSKILNDDKLGKEITEINRLQEELELVKEELRKR